MVVAAMLALAGPASAEEKKGATFRPDSCANLHTIMPPADFVILSLQGTTVETPTVENPSAVDVEKCAPKPTGHPVQEPPDSVPL